MIDYKIIFLILGVVLAFIGYFYYIRDIFLGKTKPHIYSWFIWGMLTLIGFVAQISDNAGPGAWITGITGMMCIFVAFLSIKNGEKEIDKSDKYSFLGAILAIILWYITDDALYSVFLITLVDMLGFYPTFRKSYFKPNEETLSLYLLSSFKFVFGIIALTNFTLITYLYPLSLVIMNGLFVIMVIIRRKNLSKSNLK